MAEFVNSKEASKLLTRGATANSGGELTIVERGQVRRLAKSGKLETKVVAGRYMFGVASINALIKGGYVGVTERAAISREYTQYRVYIKTANEAAEVNAIRKAIGRPDLDIKSMKAIRAERKAKKAAVAKKA